MLFNFRNAFETRTGSLLNNNNSLVIIIHNIMEVKEGFCALALLVIKITRADLRQGHPYKLKVLVLLYTRNWSLSF